MNGPVNRPRALVSVASGHGSATRRTAILSTEVPANPGILDVSVIAGVATVVGRPQTCDQARAIISRARHVQGVVAVRDRLDYPLPGPDPFDVLARSCVD